ncbi:MULTISPECIES: hydrogenase formation protein HypD [Marinovum]|jgi:hydrogenase expression/formation protein HypD|uniref:Hydrogenase maturation factor n=1 Tax=Marinovum algicola TaxID=42444 RepID=A0A975WCG8_9RHOB|nr:MULTISPECIES: hydrogenase formation protein HypD [Marinovum]MDD9746182.1 hydrogenase formation protein HypD [Marinovum sp. PR37]SEJ90922.1 Hydrogenase maturation protein HypD [Marinovum algicola]SLN42361.1 Hydrogenase expression/formation protein HypD [Marinovum algicola]
MKYADEFRDPVLARKVLNRIERTLGRIPMPEGRPLHIMEVCGGHTHSIFRYGLQKLVPDSIEFVHGPGCPVCVLPMGRVDDCVTLAEQPQVIFTTFGDAMRVPGSKGSLIEAKARGADVRMVYSPLDALELARRHPEREVVFFALGFETTMPSTALTLLQAAEEGVENFSMICQHITIIPTLKALLSDPQCLIDGFIGPGHVSMVIGNRGYGFIPDDYGKPFVVAGFEPLDLLQSLWMVLEQMAEGRASVENQYARVVPEDGNTAALRAMAEVYEDRESCDWRGLGAIDRSGVRIRAAYADFDAERKFGLVPADVADPAICQCGEVVRGQLKPHMCRAFGKECTPATPLGALMVSSEGACAAYHQYGATDLVGTRDG